ncbi:murein biosynthesis integral membrane protein MurJ [Parerythrobacter jejuensis]|uniref:Probable lipid II flippase MurJ n=1 Tax=Parerythrobacter jejuensis TaxID=795812 RepID=A0A845AUH0_9SPHN|nr:murein biosynthesis integral membrane protein MurJ [Parerythrobacter jejuensis]MXP30484.1 murein biosynthesis integral membrane protein MurJ [Parerythrobacter jejuensis]MXP33244.1 murein biosynthesis integral membrane protein MurJ [Parerythrobacter jejuensis]
MSLLKNVGTIGGLTAVSRVFGFVRDILIARVLGATAMGDAWQLAFMLPNIFRRLFAEGAFASAFVPLFNRRMKEDGDVSEARMFAENVLAVLLPVLILFGAVAMIAMPWVVEFFAPEGLATDADALAIAVFMGRVTFPYLLFMSVATLIAAVLNSLSRFAAAAAAPILLNICLIAALAYGLTMGEDPAARWTAAQAMAWALSLSGLLQVIWLYSFMRRAGFSLALVAPKITGGVKELGLLVVPAIFGAGVYQISRFVDLFFLSTLEVGSYTYLAMADRWNQLPLGIIGIALGTAILPALSRFLSREEADEAARLQSNAIELAMLLTVPCAVALFFTGTAFVQAFMVGQNFTAEDAIVTGSVVSALVLGLPAYVLVKVLTPNFFARKDTRTPVVTAAISLVVTIGLNIVLVPRIGVVGLAIAGAVGAWINIALLGAILHARGYYRLPARVAGRVLRIGLAAAAMGAALWFLMPEIADWFSQGLLDKAAGIAAIMATGIATYGLAAMLLGVLDRATIGRLMRRQG